MPTRRQTVFEQVHVRRGDQELHACRRMVQREPHSHRQAPLVDKAGNLAQGRKNSETGAPSGTHCATSSPSARRSWRRCPYADQTIRGNVSVLEAVISSEEEHAWTTLASGS